MRESVILVCYGIAIIYGALALHEISTIKDTLKSISAILKSIENNEKERNEK